MEKRKTALYDIHLAEGAEMIDLGGWVLPQQYPEGSAAEHLWDRGACSLCDFSHLSRIAVSGADALALLQRVLTSNVAALEQGRAQYGILSSESGCALDEAYLYGVGENAYFFVGNAAVRERTVDYLREQSRGQRVTVRDETLQTAAIAVQGPRSEALLTELFGNLDFLGHRKGSFGCVEREGRRLWVGRTGYTGDPVGFEVYTEACDAPWLWERLRAMGAKPAGLGARDSLRIEAGLPHFGQEYGLDRDGAELPIFAVPLARFAVHFAEKGDFTGREALIRQREHLTRRIVPVAGLDGPLTEGADLLCRGEPVGYVTSAAAAPCPETGGLRYIGLACVAAGISAGAALTLRSGGRVQVVERHLRNDMGPIARPVLPDGTTAGW